VTEILKIEGLAVQYRTRSGPFIALDSVGFSLKKGGTIGLVGESGCGKTTLGMAIMRLLPPNAEITRGRILFEGRDVVGFSEEELRTFRWKEVSMVFQAAMNALNPVKRVGDQIKEAIYTHEPRVSKAELDGRVEALFRLVNLPTDRINDYPHQYSGGMRQRAIIAMALALRPKLVIADEATTALDVIVQNQILKETKLLQREFGLSLIFISHDIAVVFEVADEVAVMYGGQVVEMGNRLQLLTNPCHPYTKALLASYPRLLVQKERLKAIPGDPFKVTAYEHGCRFQRRCPESRPDCKGEAPPWVEVEQGHGVLCLRG
jgi:peptide/nickel transport system ATP-binding protein